MKRVRSRARGDDGAVLVEAALVFPLLILLVFGIMDIGFGFRDRLTVQTAIRSGVRAGSALGNDRAADYEVLQGIRSAIADIPSSKIERIVVFRSATVAGTVPAQCAAGTSTSNGTEPCNVYTAADLVRPRSDFAGTNSCDPTAPDASWCPTSRETRASVGTDYIGVWISVQHDQVAGVLPVAGVKIVDTVVMRIEPDPRAE
jgi:Flp pilus assembly protein TadG